ncbi:radical SAM protein [Candidatus Bathyarchaeota archaeon]|nr:radical SAM protein [Candidatus Bathyarchaeota archaeon]
MRENAIFIAYQDQENLGVGYLASYLKSKGYSSKIIDWKKDPEFIYNQILEANPVLVGFSLIFQYDFNKLCRLSNYLREKGITQHFTVGGHYPSLRYKTVLDNAGSIDSVVRFEGELTLHDLVKTLHEGGNWRTIPGIAYTENGESHSNTLRPLIEDLDTLPFPERSHSQEYTCMEVKFTSLLGSRGCYRNCSFCSIRAFYGAPPGQLRRTRSPENIVDEMEELYKKDVKIYLFQDDDFFTPGPTGQDWARGLHDELFGREFSSDILWKINCRADEVTEDFFKRLREVGLYMVYLGIESGSDEGLKLMNKQLKVRDNLKAVETLKKLGMTYDFGFMLFDPLSSFRSLRENIGFLRTICEDGSAPVTFCKMLPYAGTPIEALLVEEGRLVGGITNPDYMFLSPMVDGYYDYVTQAFNEYMGPGGLSQVLRWHINELNVIEKFYREPKGFGEYREGFRRIVSGSNMAALDALESGLKVFEEGRLDYGRLRDIQLGLVGKHRDLRSSLREEMSTLHNFNQ